MAIKMIPTADEIGMILARLVIADKEFAHIFRESAIQAGAKMLPDDVKNIDEWLKVMNILRKVTVKEQ